MKGLYVSSLVITVAFFITTGYFANRYDEVDWAIFMDEIYSYDSYDSYSYESYDYRRDELRDITAMGGISALVFITFYVLTYSFTLKNIKRTTAKVMSIIGLSISGIVFLASLVPTFEPGGVSFDEEFAPLLIMYGIIMLAFCIVNLVQAVRNSAGTTSSQQIIDDIV